MAMAVGAVAAFAASAAAAAAVVVEAIVARVLPPFMKARKTRVLSGEAMAWSVSSFLRVLVLDRGPGGGIGVGSRSWLWDVGVGAGVGVRVGVGVVGYDGNQSSRRSCQRKLGGVESSAYSPKLRMGVGSRVSRAWYLATEGTPASQSVSRSGTCIYIKEKK